MTLKRAIIVSLGLLALPLAGAEAQTAGPDLRGTAGLGDGSASDIAPAEAEDAAAPVSPVYTNVHALRLSGNNAVAETGSTGLGASRRATPVRPFSDRIAAVRRLQPPGLTRADDGVFGGDTAFDQAQGLRVGTFTILPEMTVTGGATDNAAGTARGKGGGFYRFAPQVSARSDWSRHQLDLSLRGSYAGYPDDAAQADKSLNASASLRLDVSEGTTISTGLGYSFSQEDAGTAETASGSDNVQQYTGSLSGTRDLGLLSVTLRGAFDRNVYESAAGSASQDGRDNTVYTASLRLDGNTGAVLAPFAEGSALLRRYDKACSDALCEKRDANGYQLRGGVTVDAGPKLRGEIGAGWRVEQLDDNRLKDLAGLIADGSIVWSPTRLTTVTAGLGTQFASTDIDGSSGSIIYSGDLRIAHSFSDRLAGELGAGYSYRTYEGVPIEERTLTGRASATFALTRNVALLTTYSYRSFDSSTAGADYDENRIEAGVRIRH